MKIKRRVLGVLFVLVILSTTKSIAQEKTFSKEKVKKEVTLTDFNGIAVSGLAQVYIQKGLESKAYLEISGIPMSEVSVVVEKGTLKVGTTGNHSGESVKIYITYKEVNKLSVAEAAELFSKGPIETSNLEVSSSGASKAVLEIDVDLVKIKTEDRADLIIIGYAREQKIISKSRGGTFDNSGLQSKK